MSTAETRRNHIEAWRLSGLSQRAYCRIHGSNVKTFGNWLHAYKNGQSDQIASMIQITVRLMPLSADVLRLRGRGTCVGVAVGGFAALVGRIAEIPS
jgi:hypothetical protein